MPTYACPHCSGDIDSGDVNVQTDLALCRSCEQTTSFAQLHHTKELESIDLSAPPKPVRITEGLRAEKELSYRKTSKALFFLVPFTLVWGGGSMTGIYGTQIAEGFDLALSLFGIPFLLGTIALIFGCLFMAIGTWRVRIGNGTGSLFVGIGNIGRVREFQYDAHTEVLLEESKASNNGQRAKEIVIKNGNERLAFGSVIDQSDQPFIAAWILKAVRA